MKAMKMKILAALVLALILLGPRAAHAEDDAVLEARRKSADALVEAGKNAEAIPLYLSLLHDKRDPVVVYDLGRAYMAVGDHVRSLTFLEEFERIASPELRAKVPDLSALLRDVGQHVTTLDVRCNVPDAVLRVRGAVVEKFARVEAGPADLEASAPGFHDRHRALELPGGAAATIDMTLFSVPTTGVLRVQSRVTGTSVIIDGKPAGNAPIESFVAPGWHQIIARHGADEASIRDNVPGGEVHEVMLDPKPVGESVLKKWWFWTAVGVLTAGAVVLVVTTTTAKDPPSGSIGPSQVPVGLRF